MITWTMIKVATGKREEVETYADLDDALADMAGLAGEDRDGRWVGVLTEGDGHVVGASLTAMDGTLLVTLEDGRRFEFPPAAAVTQ